MRDPGGWSRPRGEPETSRMETGTSTIVPTVETEPTVTTSAAATGTAKAGAAPARKTMAKIVFIIFISSLLSPLRRLRRWIVDDRAADVQRAVEDRGVVH